LLFSIKYLKFILHLVFQFAVISSILTCALTNVARDKFGEQILDPDFKVKAYDRLPYNRGLYRLHYPISNEGRIDLFQQEIKDLKGGYVGVGTDQNFCFIAWARSKYAWLMDFDMVVVTINKIHLYFIEISPTYEEYRRLWHYGNRVTSFRLLRKRFGKNPDFHHFRKAWNVIFYGGSKVQKRFNQLDYMTRRWKLSTFNKDPEQYRYLRKMVKKGRIQAIPGDLRGFRSLRSIAKSARELGITIRIFYPSNSEDYWRIYSYGFRKNIKVLPVDSKSVIIRTSARGGRYFGYPAGETYSVSPFHYNTQPLENLKEWFNLDKPLSLVGILKYRTPMERGFSYMNTSPAETRYFYPTRKLNRYNFFRKKIRRTRIRR